MLNINSPDLTFIAEVASPHRLRLYVSPSRSTRSSLGSLPWIGWEFVINQFSSEGKELPLQDYWHEALAEVLAHARGYSDDPLEWRLEETGETTDLAALQPQFDESRRYQLALNSIEAPDGMRRLCFNIYDDGSYRFTLERKFENGELQAWIPERWSSEYPDLASAELAAREEFGWSK